MTKNMIGDTFTHKFAENFNENEKFIEENLLYEIIGGSRLYGVDTPESDFDIVSIFMDRHIDLYPQNYGYVLGFDTNRPKFEQKEIKGEGNRIIHKNIEVEGEWRSLTRFFYLAAMKGSPNLVEILFARHQNIKYINKAFYPIKDNASKFISMRTFHAFKGYLYSQFQRIRKNVERGITDNAKRQWRIDEHGFDTKMSYHVLRLLDLVDQMVDGETYLDLMRNKAECKAMRDGNWGSWDDFQSIVNNRLSAIENKISNTKLPSKPRIDELRNILNNSIEEWYGTANGQTVQNKQYISVDDIYEQLNRIERAVIPTNNDLGIS